MRYNRYNNNKEWGTQESSLYHHLIMAKQQTSCVDHHLPQQGVYIRRQHHHYFWTRHPPAVALFFENFLFYKDDFTFIFATYNNNNNIIINPISFAHHDYYRIESDPIGDGLEHMLPSLYINFCSVLSSYHWSALPFLHEIVHNNYCCTYNITTIQIKIPFARSRRPVPSTIVPDNFSSSPLHVCIIFRWQLGGRRATRTSRSTIQSSILVPPPTTTSSRHCCTKRDLYI